MKALVKQLSTNIIVVMENYNRRIKLMNDIQIKWDIETIQNIIDIAPLDRIERKTLEKVIKIVEEQDQDRKSTRLNSSH